MLTRFKNFINNSDTFIILTIILIALIAFGIGRLSVPKNEPILIENLEKANVKDLIISTKEQETTEINYKGKVLGSKNSEKY